MEQDRDTAEFLVEPPETTDWADSEYLVMNDFQDLASKRIELKLEQDHLAKRIEELNLELVAMLKSANLRTVRFGYHRLARGQSTSGGRLSKERLLEMGITAEQIEKATLPKRPGREFISVTEIRGPED